MLTVKYRMFQDRFEQLFYNDVYPHKTKSFDQEKILRMKTLKEEFLQLMSFFESNMFNEHS